MFQIQSITSAILIMIHNNKTIKNTRTYQNIGENITFRIQYKSKKYLT